MTAIEELVGSVRTTSSIWPPPSESLLRQEDYPERQVAIALASYRQQIALSDSQITRFFDFLEDEALVRIRLHVTYRLMDAIAEAAAGRLGTRDARDMRTLIAYVRRARALFLALGSGESGDVYLNLASEYGDQADFALSDEAALVGFSGCLPVWPESVAQIFEHQRRASDQPALLNTVREVSYRFRVNGINPEDRRTAFVSRLTRIREALLISPEPQRVRRNLAELVFLAAVVPTNSPRDDGRAGVSGRCPQQSPGGRAAPRAGGPRSYPRDAQCAGRSLAASRHREPSADHRAEGRGAPSPNASRVGRGTTSSMSIAVWSTLTASPIRWIAHWQLTSRHPKRCSPSSSAFRSRPTAACRAVCSRCRCVSASESAA